MFLPGQGTPYKYAAHKSGWISLRGTKIFCKRIENEYKDAEHKLEQKMAGKQAYRIWSWMKIIPPIAKIMVAMLITVAKSIFKLTPEEALEGAVDPEDKNVIITDSPDVKPPLNAKIVMGYILTGIALYLTYIGFKGLFDVYNDGKEKVPRLDIPKDKLTVFRGLFYKTPVFGITAIAVMIISALTTIVDFSTTCYSLYSEG